MKTITIPITVRFSDAERRFGDAEIWRRMREQVVRPPASKLLTVRVIEKLRDHERPGYTAKGEVTFGRWFPFRHEEQRA
jgi:hypothetical protein